MISKDNNERQG